MTTTRKLLAVTITLTIAAYIRHRRFTHGVYQTLSSLLLYWFRRRFLSSNTASAIADIKAKQEIVQHPDGEESIVWWSPATIPATTSKHLFVVLPGGMKSGDASYVWEAIIDVNLFEHHPFVIFHNPGINNLCKQRSPSGLTEVLYLEHFIDLLRYRGFKVSLVGFSAGSMLAIKMCGKSPEKVECAVAIHGPDKIRHVMEYHQQCWTRLDILFARSLAVTMIKSGCTIFLNQSEGGGLEKEWLPWWSGWVWMMSYTEKCFHSNWHDMEEEYWSCTDVMETPMRTPVFRVLSENDPIVPLETINHTLFPNLDRVVIQTELEDGGGGHCAAFHFDNGKLARTLKEWYEEIFAREEKLVCDRYQ